MIKEAALWFESHGSKNLTGGTTWSSQSTSTDWLTRTHHWSSPRSKLAYKKPTSTRKLRKFPVTSGQGSKHRDWTASRWWARWRSQSSSCQHHVTTWRGLIPADHEYLDSVAWPCHDCEVAPVWHHDVTNPRTCQFSAVCLTVFPFEFRPRTFTIGFYGKNSIISELMILECSFPLNGTFSWTACLESFNRVLPVGRLHSTKRVEAMLAKLDCSLHWGKPRIPCDNPGTSMPELCQPECCWCCCSLLGMPLLCCHYLLPSSATIFASQLANSLGFSSNLDNMGHTSGAITFFMPRKHWKFLDSLSQRANVAST